MQGTATAPATTDQPRYVITPDDKERIKAAQAAWDAYHGKLKKPLVPMPGQADDNVMVNVCLPPVERIKDFLFGQELEITVGKAAKGRKASKNKTRSPEQIILDQTWGRKETRMPLLQKLHNNGALCRNAFLRIVPSRVKPGREQTFRLVVPDPMTVYLETAPGDVDTVLCYIVQYSYTKTVNGRPQQVYSREEIRRIGPNGQPSEGDPDEDDTWLLQKWYQVGTSGMEPKADRWLEDGPPIAWPYPFSPLQHCQNLPLPNEAWGMPDITPGIIGLNNAINLSKSSANRNNKLLAQPIIGASGMDPAGISLTPGHVNVHAIDGKIYAVPIHSDIAGSYIHIKDLREDVDQEGGVPSVASGRMESLPRLTSGVAVELMYGPLTMKTATKRCTYGELLISISKAILVLAGFSADNEISLPWQSPLPHDDLQGMQATVLKKQIGVSEETLQEEEGYDPEIEAERNAEAAQNQLDMFAKGQGMPPTMPGQPPMPTQSQPAQQQDSPFMARTGGQ